jgi:glycosyltransferase involved in cell wall biosynthesis
MNNSFAYLPPEQRKKILLICDDIRVHSGVATVGREVVVHTSHHFNWVNIAGSINHPEMGKRLDLSKSTDEVAGITDSSVILYPTNDYGGPDMLRQLIQIEKPDAIMLITDPRYFTWLFAMENEIRKDIPITYLNIWDDYPAPLYNKPYYEACDLLMGISKQTVNINNIVLGDKAKNRILRYVPHGLNENLFYPIDSTHEEWNQLQEFKKNYFQGKEYEFALFFNSRNIRRKQIPDTMLAYKHFIDQLPIEKAKKCVLVLHTELVSEHGTDLPAVQELLLNGEQYNVVYTNKVLGAKEMNLLYNSTDAQILLTSNEGWGLSLTEAILVGNPIIANVTGGMQDQMRFEDEEGNWFTPTPEIPSNNTGRYKKHGEWAFPVYPTNRSIQGSPQTPYIWDDRCRPEDAAEQIMAIYSLDKKERKAKGLAGREWALNEAGFTGKIQGERIIEAFGELFKTWEPREKFEFINVNEVKDRVNTHNLLY